MSAQTKWTKPREEREAGEDPANMRERVDAACDQMPGAVKARYRRRAGRWRVDAGG